MEVAHVHRRAEIVIGHVDSEGGDAVRLQCVEEQLLRAEAASSKLAGRRCGVIIAVMMQCGLPEKVRQMRTGGYPCVVVPSRFAAPQKRGIQSPQAVAREARERKRLPP